MPKNLDEAVALLTNSSSPKRRYGAKHLRKLADAEAGPFLFQALQAEVEDERTWETQYQMIMALGECGYAPAEELLQGLAKQRTGYDMVGVSLGDALLRIELADRGTLTVIDRNLLSGCPGVVDGTFRATAMLRLVPDKDLIGRIVEFGGNQPLESGLRFWIAVAAAGRPGRKVNRYLRGCQSSGRDDLTEAAAMSLEGTYGIYRPL